MLSLFIGNTTSTQTYVPPPITAQQAGDASAGAVTLNAVLSMDGRAEQLIPPTPAVTKNGLGGSFFKLGHPSQSHRLCPFTWIQRRSA